MAFLIVYYLEKILKVKEKKAANKHIIAPTDGISKLQYCWHLFWAWNGFMPQYLMVNLKYKFEAKIRNDYVEYT